MPYAAWKLAAFVGGPEWLTMTIRATRAMPLPVVLPIELSPSQIAEMRPQLVVKLWIQLMDATTNTQFKEWIHDYRLYRKWVANNMGISDTMSATLLEYEKLLLQLDDDEVSAKHREWNEQEVSEQSGHSPSLRSFDIAHQVLGNVPPSPLEDFTHSTPPARACSA